jgi:hypothetical protein
VHREAVIQIVSDHYTVGLRVLFLCLLRVQLDHRLSIGFTGVRRPKEPLFGIVRTVKQVKV